MKLGELADVIPGAKIIGDSSVGVEAIELDSRKVRPGSLFFALRGFSADGNTFTPDAVRKGAAAVLTDDASAPNPGVPVVIVHDARKALALAADRFHGSPQKSLVMTAVTGTNGKTTTTWMVKSIFDSGGFPCGLIGTIRHIVGDETV